MSIDQLISEIKKAINENLNSIDAANLKIRNLVLVINTSFSETNGVLSGLKLGPFPLTVEAQAKSNTANILTFDFEVEHVDLDLMGEIDVNLSNAIKESLNIIKASVSEFPKLKCNEAKIELKFTYSESTGFSFIFGTNNVIENHNKIILSIVNKI